MLKQAAADARLPDPVATISALNRFTPELFRHENRNIKNYIQYRILMNLTDSANSSTFFDSCNLLQFEAANLLNLSGRQCRPWLKFQQLVNFDFVETLCNAVAYATVVLHQSQKSLGSMEQNQKFYFFRPC